MSASLRIKPAEQPTRNEWLQARRSTIGASEIAAVVGISPYKSPLQLYLEKTGQITPEEETWAMWWGTADEPALMAAYEKKTGRRLVPNGLRVFRHPKVSCVSSTPDAFEMEGVPPDGVELKSPGFRSTDDWGKEGTDEVPDIYLCQVAIQMATTNRARWRVLRRHSNDEPMLYEVKRDGELEASLLDAAARFWRDHVEKKVPPEASRLDLDALKQLYPKEEGEVREATPYERGLLEKLFPLKDRIETEQATFDELKAKLIAALGECPGLVVPGIGKLSYKYARGRTVVDWEAVAAKFNPPPLLVEQHTRVLDGTRRFRLTAEKQKGGVQ